MIPLRREMLEQAPACVQKPLLPEQLARKVREVSEPAERSAPPM